MPCLPVSEFWQRSFFKYYELQWIESNGYNASNAYTQLMRYNIPFMVIASLILYCFVLSIPLSTHITLSPGAIALYPPLYIIYQVLYTWLSYPCTIQLFSIALPTTLQSKVCRYILLPIPIFLGVTIIYIVYSPTMPGSHRLGSNTFVRTLGPFIQHFYLAVVFLIAVCFQSIWKYCKHCRKKEPIITDAYSMSSSSFCSVTGTATATNDHEHCSALASPIVMVHELQRNLTPINQCNECIPVTDSVRHTLWQALFTILITTGLTAAYYWCQFLTWKWKAYNVTERYLWNELQNGSILFYYPVFWIVIYVLKFATTRCARYCDSNKYSKYSLELIVSFFCTCFYYVFYRNLFLHMGSYGYFVFVKVLHIGLELISYPVRMSRNYYKFTDRLQNRYKEGGTGLCAYVVQPLMWILYDPSSYHIWCIRICVNYSMTLIVSVGSAICYFVGVIWLRYGYNAYFYDVQNISDEQFTKTLVFTVIGIGIELIIYGIIEFIMRDRYQMDVMKHWTALMRHRPGYIWYFLFMLQHVNTDVMIAKLQI